MKESIPLIYPQCADKALFSVGETVVSQEEFSATVGELAKSLPSIEFVINLCHDRYHFTLAFCAALINNSVNLLPSNRQPQTIADLADDYPKVIAIIDTDVAADAVPSHVVCFDIRELLNAVDVEGAIQGPILIEEDCVAAIAFTSGSTGKPTANKKYFRTLAGTARLLAARLLVDGAAVSSGDVDYSIVATVPSQHMYGLEMTVFMALQGGALVHSSTPFYPQDIAGALGQARLNRVLVTTPVHARALIKAGIELPETLKVISATAKLSSELAADVEKAFASIEEIYGCTEAGSMATRRTIVDQSWSLLDGMSMVDNSHQITVYGPQLFGPTPISDLLELLDGQKFKLLGRAQDMINVAGKRASLADLTNKLLSIDGVEDGVVFLPEEAGGKELRPMALVVSEKIEHEILKEMSSLIDPVFLPRPLRKIKVLKRNETGKLTRAILMQQLESLGEC